MELQEKEAQKIKANRKSLYEEPTGNRCMLIQDLQPFRSKFEVQPKTHIQKSKLGIKG